MGAWYVWWDRIQFRQGAHTARSRRGLYSSSPFQCPEYRSRWPLFRRPSLAGFQTSTEAEALIAHSPAPGTIAVGLFLVRLAKGSHAAVERTRVNDEVWLPRQVRAFVSARLGLLKVLRFEQEISYSRCREFQADPPAISQMKAR
jgi:hypothetical protein